MKASEYQPRRGRLWRGFCALPVAWAMVGILCTLLFAPATIPLAAATLTLLPAQGPSEEESNSSHGGEALLVQRSSISSGWVRRLASSGIHPHRAPRFDFSSPTIPSRAALRMPAELAGRNGTGAPLRC